MHVHPYLNFQGQCEAAFQFYERALGGKIANMMKHGDSPMAEHVPPDWHNAIIHARIDIAGLVVMGSDMPPDRYQPTQGFSMAISVPEPAEAERIFNALSENGTVQMPLQQTFWALRFGMVVDAFGIPWMVNCEVTA